MVEVIYKNINAYSRHLNHTLMLASEDSFGDADLYIVEKLRCILSDVVVAVW
jgi:hypothetical protein